MSSHSVHQPLEDTTNSQPASPISLPTEPTLHRKHNIKDLHARLNSSDTEPSVHSSLYNASLQQDAKLSSLENMKVSAVDWPEATAFEFDAPAWENVVLDEDGNRVPASFLQPTQSSHTPHRLDPIKEQNSIITLRSRYSRASTLKPRSRSRSPALLSQHKRSFSTADVPETLFERTHQSSSSGGETVQVDISQPIVPLRRPPERPATPPNLPTFGSPEALLYRLPAPQPKGLRDRMRLMTPAEKIWHRQTAGLPRGILMRDENGTVVYSRFRPIRSGQLPAPTTTQRRQVRNGQAIEGTEGTSTEQTEDTPGLVKKLAKFCCPFAGESEDLENVRVHRPMEMHAVGQVVHAR